MSMNKFPTKKQALYKQKKVKNSSSTRSLDLRPTCSILLSAPVRGTAWNDLSLK